MRSDRCMFQLILGSHKLFATLSRQFLLLILELVPWKRDMRQQQLFSPFNKPHCGKSGSTWYNLSQGREVSPGSVSTSAAATALLASRGGTLCGGFPWLTRWFHVVSRNGDPQKDGFCNREIPLKWMISGYPPFMETSIWSSGQP